MNKTAHWISRLLIFGLITTFVVFFFYKLSVVAERSRSTERLEKKAKEIERIESHSYDRPNCEQYALVATENGWFPCFRCGTKDSIFLYKGEVWKYGKTCNGQDGRYTNGLPFKYLRYKLEFSGTESECLIQEKEKIYNYPNLPECQKRNFSLLRPPGNKIDR